ncbi:hypothetical protein K08M3_39460 [Vibrio alginolyticus]|uniref:Uncharacterized protein n=2 Tax=Vibrio harveyi group TaxID=717610 RepID=A0A1W6W1R0_VIBAL|nr:MULTISPECIES: hypothetical protein [Vibrio]MDW2293175.1 hypothetical protein [Vibrio sp. 1404]HDY7614446.1 hypothetical protein [Vibrio vulnificus]ARP00790.1 hypothetical protein K01M1_39610 [Vibrio alginolyticus]ARP05490.1 hypothetical protein K04M1_39540 [Vibrio alginolyticus]ARP10548.1 hypothetical protein K04M3_39560 [Vibrio alginolyticus]
MNINTLSQLIENLESNNKLDIELHDSERMVGFKLGQKNILIQIQNIIKQIEEGD